LPAAVASPPRGGFVNGVALAFPDGDNDDDQFVIADLINRTITDTPENREAGVGEAGVGS
jgi:hypothetical protein